MAGIGTLSALDPATGAVRWTFEEFTLDRRAAPFQGTGERVYGGSAGGYAFALDAATGRIAWSTRVADSLAVAYEPVLDGSQVFVGVRYRNRFPADSAAVVALDRVTGAIQWVTAFPRGGSGAGKRVVVAGRYVVAPAGAAGLYVLDRTNGDIIWSGIPPEYAKLGLVGAAVSRGRVYTAFSAPVVVAQDLSTGKELWSLWPQTPSARAVSADEESVYVTFYGDFVVIDAARGRERWRAGYASTSSGSNASFSILDALVVGDRMYAATTNGFYALASR